MKTSGAKFGIIEKTVKAFGCTSEAQALRLARAIVFSEEEESEEMGTEEEEEGASGGGGEGY